MSESVPGLYHIPGRAAAATLLRGLWVRPCVPVVCQPECSVSNKSQVELQVELYDQEYLTRRLRLKDTELELLHTGTPDGEEVGPLERGFTSATSPGPLSLRGLRLGGMVGSWVPRRRA